MSTAAQRLAGCPPPAASSPPAGSRSVGRGRRTPLPSFNAFYEAYHTRVYRFLVAAVGLPDAEDVLQETFLAALRAYPHLDREANLRAWILTIAERKAIDAYRSRTRRAIALDALPEIGTDPPEAQEPFVWRAVRDLPERQRSAVFLRFVGDLPYRDIARFLGCTNEAARRSVHEGLKRLRAEWSQAGILSND